MPTPQPRKIIRYWSNLDPSRPALRDGERRLNYGELQDLTTSIEGVLGDSGYLNGMSVGVAFNNSIEYITAFFSVIQSGGVVVPFDPNSPLQLIKKIVESAGLSFVIADKNLDLTSMSFEKVLSSPIPEDFSLWIVIGAKSEHLPRQNQGNLLHQFTSGSTGNPKHLIRTESQIYEDYCHWIVAFSLGGDERYLALPPFHHAYGQLGLLATMAAGGEVCILSRFLPSSVIKLGSSFSPTLMMVTPAMVDMLNKTYTTTDRISAFSSLRYCICSTGFLGLDAYFLFKEAYGISLYVQYGSTETLSVAVSQDSIYESGLVGFPYSGVNVRIFKVDGTEALPNELGRIGVSSPCCPTAYIGGDDKLAVCNGYILPGDIGWIDDLGRLYVSHRDDIYNIGGYKVSRGEVELVIKSAFNLETVAVLVYMRNGQPSLRVVIETEQKTVTAERVVAICKNELPSYKVPSKVDIYSKITKDSNGKVLFGLEL